MQQNFAEVNVADLSLDMLRSLRKLRINLKCMERELLVL